MTFALTQLAGFAARRIGATATYNGVSNWSTSKYLSRTPATNGSATIATLSLWVKRSGTGATSSIAGFDTSGTGTLFWPRITSTNTIGHYISGAGTTHASSGTYSSTTTWYHLVFAIDTTQGTAANRNRMYVNGSEVSYGDSNNYGASAAIKMNQTAGANTIGTDTIDAFNGIIAHVHWIDGAQLTPTSFAQAGVTGAVPKAYTGSFGTNGFLLDFANSADIGNDVSGVGNDLTVTGLVSGDVSSQTVFY